MVRVEYVTVSKLCLIVFSYKMLKPMLKTYKRDRKEE